MKDSKGLANQSSNKFLLPGVDKRSMAMGVFELGAPLVYLLIMQLSMDSAEQVKGLGHSRQPLQLPCQSRPEMATPWPAWLPGWVSTYTWANSLLWQLLWLHWYYKLGLTPLLGRGKRRVEF